MEYQKIELGVEAAFFTNGTIIPHKLSIGTQKYKIDRIIGCRPRNPGTVSCISPIEYIVIVEGQTKKIYFEPETHQWFSIKERR